MALLELGLWVGAAFGTAHGVYVYRRRTRAFGREVGASALGSRARATYYALWTLGLWTLAGPYLAVLWLVASALYVATGGRFRRAGVRPDYEEAVREPDEAPLERSDELRRVAVIGAGVAGLATARALLEEGLDCTVFERNERLGGVWADGYPGFGVQVQRELYEFPDWPLPADTPDFTPGPTIQRYLESYAQEFGIAEHIRLGTSVRRLVRAESGAGWQLELAAAAPGEALHFDFVVVAIGVYSQTPYVPELAGRELFAGQVLHISELKGREDLRGHRVLVVGYGKSATDVALESASVAERTAIAIRTPHWPVPPLLAGVLPFKWGLLNRLCSTIIPYYHRPTALERAVLTLGKPLVWLYWRLVEGLLVVQLRLGSRWGTRVGLVPAEPVEIGGFDESTMLPRPEFHRALRDGSIEPHHATIVELERDGARLSDGSFLEVDTVLTATGWRTDFDFLPADVRSKLGFSDDGFYLYRHMLHPDVPDLAFVGRATTVVSILTYSLQARWLAEWLGGRMELPGPETMRAEIESLARWKRSWIPHSDARSARLILHMQHYHDELLEDFGADPLRKRGAFAPLKELFAPYEPRDYAAISSGATRRGAPCSGSREVPG